MKFIILPIGPGSNITIDWGDGSAVETYTGDGSETFVENMINHISAVFSGATTYDPATIALGDTPYHVYDDSFNLTEVDVSVTGNVTYWHGQILDPEFCSDYITYEAMVANITDNGIFPAGVLSNVKQWGAVVMSNYVHPNSTIGVNTSLTTNTSSVIFSATDVPNVTNTGDLNNLFSNPMLIPAIEISGEFGGWSGIAGAGLTETDIGALLESVVINDTLDMSSMDLSDITIPDVVSDTANVTGAIPAVWEGSFIVNGSYTAPTFTLDVVITPPADWATWLNGYTSPFTNPFKVVMYQHKRYIDAFGNLYMVLPWKLTAGTQYYIPWIDAFKNGPLTSTTDQELILVPLDSDVDPEDITDLTLILEISGTISRSSVITAETAYDYEGYIASQLALGQPAMLYELVTTPVKEAGDTEEIIGDLIDNINLDRFSSVANYVIYNWGDVAINDFRYFFNTGSVVIFENTDTLVVGGTVDLEGMFHNVEAHGDPKISFNAISSLKSFWYGHAGDAAFVQFFNDLPTAAVTDISYLMYDYDGRYDNLTITIDTVSADPSTRTVIYTPPQY